MAAILLVEDDAPMANLYARALTGQGHQIIIAPGNQQAIESLKNTHPDLIILDMTLPDGPGTSVLDHLEQNPSIPFTPVVIMTGFSRFIKQGERPSVIEYLAKPVTPSQLIQSVNGALENLREE